MKKHEVMQLHLFLRALGDESRLRIYRLLGRGEISVGELAEAMELREPTVSHHLNKLREAGLVTLRAEGNLRFYRQSRPDLERFRKLLARIEEPDEEYEPIEDDQSWIDALGWPPEHAQVLRDYTFQGRLKRLPVRKQKPLKVILYWLTGMFEFGRDYSEAEVNEVIRSVYEKDYVSLRRDLISYGCLLRDASGRRYHRAEDLSLLA